MRAEGKKRGSETHLQKAVLPMNTFPLSFPSQLIRSTKKGEGGRERGRQRATRGRGMTLFQFCHTPRYRPAGLFRGKPMLSVRLIKTPLSFHRLFFFLSVLDLHVNYSEEQIIYVSYPFLRAHFSDYSVFLSVFSIIPLPPSHCGQENAFCLFNCTQNLNRRGNCPIK